MVDRYHSALHAVNFRVLNTKYLLMNGDKHLCIENWINSGFAENGNFVLYFSMAYLNILHIKL